MPKKKTLIFIPTYNERGNVDAMCREIFALGLDADLVFMDDASPDGTGERLEELAKENKRLSVLHRSGKLGVGGAHLDGIAYAYDKGYSRLVTLDCDFTHSPSLIPTFLKKGEEAAVVVGSRYLETDSLPGWTLFRRSLTKLGHVMTERLLGLAEDATGAFRVYDLEKIPRELFQLVHSRGYAFFFESLLIVHRNGFSIAEVPLKLPARTYGSSKMNMAEIRRSVGTLADLFLASQLTPTRFLMPRDKRAGLDPNLVDPQNWNEYWDKKALKTTAAYDAVATVYRNLIIKRRLEKTILKEFPEGAKLLHAGCGSGQVDQNLHDHVQITAVDISTSALDVYQRENPKVHAVKHASIFELPFADASFDGAYNLGVVEHFSKDELSKVFSELHRVTKPGGKLVVFWPHAYATSVAVLNSMHWLLNDVMHKDVRLHPPEYSLVHSAGEAKDLLAHGGFKMSSYEFGPKDMFVQAVVVAERV